MRCHVVAVFVLVCLAALAVAQTPTTSAPTNSPTPLPTLPPVPCTDRSPPDCTQEPAHWVRLSESNFIAPRNKACFVHDRKNERLIVFGGRDGGGNDLNDVWVFSLVANLWLPIETTNSPPPRSDMVCGVDSFNDRLLVFGGRSGNSALGDFWSLSLTVNQEGWSEVNVTSSNSPPKRYGAVGGIYAGEPAGELLFVTHGIEGAGALRDDTWAFNVTTNEWDKRASGDSSAFVIGGRSNPAPRFGASGAVTGPGEIIMYGGCGAGGFTACPSWNGYRFRQTDNKWEEYATCPPRFLNGAGSALPNPDVQSRVLGGRLMIYGGEAGPAFGGEYSPGSTLWTVRGATMRERFVGYRLPGNDDEEDFDTSTWPGYRMQSSMTLVHPLRNGVSQAGDFTVLFGGFTDRRNGTGTATGARSLRRSDLWKLEGQLLVGVGEVQECARETNMRMVHGIMMFVAFGVIFPLGILLPRYFKKLMLSRFVDPPLWYRIHVPLMIFGTLIAFASFVVINYTMAMVQYTAMPHAAFGIIAMACVIYNPISGIFRPKGADDNPSGARKTWNYIHWWSGRAGIIFGFINIMLGLQHLSASTPVFAVYLVWVILYIGLYAILLIKKKNDLDFTWSEVLTPKYVDRQ